MRVVEARRHRLRVILLVASILCVLVLAIALLLPALPHARPAPAPGDRSIVAVGEALFPPFLFIEDGVAKGFDIDLVNELARRKSLNIEIRLMSWTEAMDAVRGGKADLLIGVSDLEERRAYLSFSERMLSMRSYLFVNADSYAFSRLEDLRGRPVGVQKGDITSQFLAKTHHQILQQEYPDQESVIEALARHEIEVAALDYYGGLLSLQKLRLQSQIKIIGEPLIEAAYCLGVKKGNSELLFSLNDGIEGAQERRHDKKTSGQMARHEPRLREDMAVLPLRPHRDPHCLGLPPLLEYSLRRAVRIRTESLAESDELFRLYLEHSPIYMFFKDENLRSLKLSRNFETLLSRPLSELLGESTTEIFPPEIASGMDATDRETLKEGIVTDLMEDFGEKTYHTIKFPIQRQGKPAYLAGFMIDITERKRAEERIIQSLREKETLIRELYHRTRNTLQVIGSMLALQAAKTPGDEELRRLVDVTKERIQAIALVHQMLYSSQDLSRLSIKDYVEKLAAQISSGRAEAGGAAASLDIAVEDRPCLIDTAIPLGLIINELIVNSIEHAFPAGKGGRISISLAPEGAGQDEAAIFRRWPRPAGGLRLQGPGRARPEPGIRHR